MGTITINKKTLEKHCVISNKVSVKVKGKDGYVKALINKIEKNENGMILYVTIVEHDSRISDRLPINKDFILYEKDWDGYNSIVIN